eukprot:scaffold6278_cov135-Skeletonema_dohrnii-CCMP3373.AAC.6
MKRRRRQRACGVTVCVVPTHHFFKLERRRARCDDPLRSLSHRGTSWNHFYKEKGLIRHLTNERSSQHH